MLSKSPHENITPPADLRLWRSEFPAVKDSVYLINHSLGAMPRAVYSHVKKYADTWNDYNARVWEESWWNMVPETGNIIAEILNAPANTISLHSSVTIAAAIVLSCFDFTKKRNTVIYSNMNFPTITYLVQSWTSPNVKHIKVNTEDGISVPAEKITDTIDDRTLLVCISHVLYQSSYLQDVAAIIEKAHACGAYVLVDVYQSAGTVPIDMRTMKPDFVVGGSIKWLCGGPGAAYLYVNPDIALKLKPKITGWMAHENPFEFADDMRYSDNISYRFLNGTPHIPALFAARAGFDIIRKIGVDAIRKHSLELTRTIIEHAHNYGLGINTPLEPERRGGTVVLRADNSERIARELVRRKFLVDWRPRAGIRISPHFYNTHDEVEAVTQEIHRLSLQYAR